MNFVEIFWFLVTQLKDTGIWEHCCQIFLQLDTMYFQLHGLVNCQIIIIIKAMCHDQFLANSNLVHILGSFIKYSDKKKSRSQACQD